MEKHAIEVTGQSPQPADLVMCWDGTYPRDWAGKGPLPRPNYDAEAIVREIYAAHLLPVAREANPPEKLFEPTKMVAKRFHGQITAEEYRRLVRGVVADLNSKALIAQASAEASRATNIINGVMEEVTERVGLGVLRDQKKGKGPVIDMATGCLYEPEERKAEEILGL